MAMGVTCPIIVLNAYDVMVASETPLERVRVSNTSAGMIQERGPQVHENEKLYNQVMIIKPQWAPVFLLSGGNCANSMQAMIKVTMFPRLPQIKLQRRPSRSMKRMQRN